MELAQILRHVTIFQDLNEDELLHVVKIAREKFYKRKSAIFHEGSDKDAVYFLQDGLVKTYKTDVDGNEQIVSILQSGEMFPHTDFFNHAPYPATAETLVDTRLVVIPVQDFEQLILEVPTISMKLIDVMGAKIRELQHKLQQIAGHDVHGRILSLLLQLAQRLGERRGSYIHIELPITNQELANSIGTTRETVNRLLNQLKKLDIIAANRSEIIIKDLDALKNWRG